MRNVLIFIFLITVSVSVSAGKEKLLYPFVLSSAEHIKDAPFVFGRYINSQKKTATEEGLSVIRTQRVDRDTAILFITDDKLNRIVSKERYGGASVTLKVSIVKKKDIVETSFLNPEYIANLYQFKKNTLRQYNDKLKEIFGFQEYFGEGVEKKTLRKMFNFSRQSKNSLLAIEDGKSKKSRVKTFESQLKEMNQYKLLYKINLKNKRQTLLSISLRSKNIDILNEKYLLSKFDNRKYSRASALPLDVIIDGNKTVVIEPKLRHELFFNTKDMKKKEVSIAYLSLFNHITNTQVRELASK